MHVLGETGSGGAAQVGADVECLRTQILAHHFYRRSDRVGEHRAIWSGQHLRGCDMAARRYHDMSVAVGILVEHHENVAIFEQDTPIDLIAKVKPSVLVKGGDYTREQVVGYEIVEAGGGEVLLIDILPGHSTTSLVDRARGGPA